MKRVFSCLICALLLCAAALPVPVRADTGPKPVLNIRVKNAPDCFYYLDLLIQDPGRYDNLEHGASAPYDPSLLSGLHRWESEGWYPAFAGGTKAPLFGDLVGTRTGGDLLHSFTYHGLPATFRIAVSSADGTVQAVSRSFTRTAFHTSLTYDYASNTISQVTPVWLSYLVQFISTCLPTLVIEGLFLMLFGFSLWENRMVFLTVNLITQALLTTVTGSFLILLGMQFLYYPALLLAELIVFALEAGVYARALRGHTVKRRIAYALCANTASCIFGLLTLRPLASFLQTL
ncbi:MAG: hypothetical protein LKK00_10230 [Intestinimonas sp.]|nr:hypothetical protein [Intestinimonas sp.]